MSRRVSWMMCLTVAQPGGDFWLVGIMINGPAVRGGRIAGERIVRADADGIGGRDDFGALTSSHIRDSFPDMETDATEDNAIDRRIAQRLRALRAERNWSLDDLAKLSNVSRATLSRLENAAVSPTASVLGKLCVAYGLPMSRLMHMVEEDFAALVPRAAQPLWTDASVGFRRRSVSPPAQALSGEALECELDAGVRIDYEASPRPGLEHHLILLEGQLQITVDGQSHDLEPGDCLRYQLFGPSAFVTPAHSAAHYILFIV
jgi:transcriptional regulator with XRE-family HTH domain